jgi:broad specificity phosphatase PhoE
MSGGVIFLVRHGETEWNLARRYQGWGDSPLTRRGVAQAEAIGRRLRSLTEAADVPVVSSPLGRAHHTAELIQAARVDLTPITVDDRLKEISIGSWDGLDRDEIEARSPGIFDGDGHYDWYFQTPDGETYDAFAGRIAAWLGEVQDRVLIIVAHGIVTRMLRGLYAGLPRSIALSLPVPQGVIWRLAGGRIEEIAA